MRLHCTCWMERSCAKAEGPPLESGPRAGERSTPSAAFEAAACAAWIARPKSRLASNTATTFDGIKIYLTGHT